eukprot:TRINITY_DN42562_c0_g1_i1.p1 TRINITY_DN42562_c0_g1~~TRINITY_DN42562_c0_g1_i1.p1  ORF type:complete len:219 (+),score=56.05 TRINITY_DN42562_c0_g1_i1:1-657(+)
MLSADARIEALSWSSLRRNVVGYRNLLWQVRAVQEEQLLTAAREAESLTGLEKAMPEYYKVLASEFEGDGVHLFELFSEVDVSNNLLLEATEVEALLRLLDTNASKTELERYISEINLSEGPLSYASLVDWWEQARSVKNSLVSEKGAGLIASIKAQSVQRGIGGLFSETAVQRRWAEAAKEGRLQALRRSYLRTLKEIREYKNERDLRLLEQNCAAW